VAVASIRAIVFDIGGVILRADVKRALGRLAGGSSHAPADVMRMIQTDPLWQDWQEGRIAARDWHAHLAGKLGVTLSFEEFCDVWNGAIDPTPLLPDDFFATLAARYKLALLSNTDPIHIAHEQSAFSFFRHFSARIFSCTVGISKPHPEIYRHALEACGTAASESVYIDDVEAYVSAARQLGMHGIVCSSPEQLRESLQTLVGKIH
jgi:glucose-1-phosphatase